MLDRRVEQIADAAREGACPSTDELVYLWGFPPHSPEAAYVRATAREMTRAASGGRGFIHAQIGVDRLPCPVNCAWCSFAEKNARGAGEADRADEEGRIVPVDEIVAYARVFDECGAQLVSLMATAALPIERYLEMVAAVREALADDVCIMANYRDVSAGEAAALHDAGARAFYHARRLGEGQMTRIDPARRYETMENVRAAGLFLMTGIDPVWHETPADEMAACLQGVARSGAWCVGACGVVGLEGREIDGHLPPLSGEVRYAGALARLVCGPDVAVGGAGNAMWVDAGCDARERGFDAGEAGGKLRVQMERARRQLGKEGWTVPARPAWDVFGKTARAGA